MEINGRTETCGLIGYPVEHTLSPVIHNTLAERLHCNLVYVPFPVKKEMVKEAIEGAKALHLLGLNVTVPHKSAVIPYLKEIDELAEKIGAVNTLVRCDGGYKGYNTDMTGLKRAMETDGVLIKDQEIILLGAGGVARAVAFLCAYSGAGKVYMLNRTLATAKKVADEVNNSIGKTCIQAYALDEYDRIPKGKYLCIQGTSVGLSPKENDTVMEDAAFYDLVHTGYDLIYRPYETRFMKLVKEHGGKAYNGLKMLAYQGIMAFELWNNLQVAEEDVQMVITRMKEELGINEN